MRINILKELSLRPKDADIGKNLWNEKGGRELLSDSENNKLRSIRWKL